MGVRGPAPNHAHALEAQCEKLASRSRLSLTVRHTLLSTLRRLRRLLIAGALRRCERSSIDLTRRQQGPNGACHLVGECNDHKHPWLTRQHLPKPGPRLGAVFDSLANNGTRSNDQQAPQRSLAHFRGRTELLLAAAGVLRRRKPDPGREVAAPPERARRRCHRRQCRSGYWTHSRNGREPSHLVVFAGATSDLAVEKGNPFGQELQRGDEHAKHYPGGLRQIGGRIFYLFDELRDVTGALGDNQPIFSEMAAQGVDRLCPLPYQKVPCSEDNGVSLGCLALHRHKAHRRPLRRLADRLGVSGIVLLPLDKRLYVGRRDKTDHMAKLADPARPIVGAAAGFHRHHARRPAGEKRKHLLAPQPLPKYDIAGCISSVCLKYSLRQVQTDRANFRHGRLLFGGNSTPPLWHTKAVGRRPPHHALGQKVPFRRPRPNGGCRIRKRSVR